MSTHRAATQVGNIGRSMVLLMASALSGGCAATIAAAVPVARVAPNPPIQASLRVCWAQFATKGAFTASGIVVFRPEGALLIDAGQSQHFADEIREMPERDWYLRAVPGGLVPKRPASAVLADLGVSSLALFIPTHAHSDHVGGLMDLPDVPVLLPRAEREALARVASGGSAFNIVPAHARRIAGQAQEMAFEPAPYEVFASHADIYGDGSVVAVPLSGHTPGSIGIFLNTADQRIFLIGDAANRVHAVDARRGKSFLLARTDADRAAADAIVARLADLHDQVPTLAILPAHERSTWERLFGSPGACLGT